MMVQSIFVAILTYSDKPIKHTESTVYYLPVVTDDGLEILKVCVGR
jgi:hypothetical protein